MKNDKSMFRVLIKLLLIVSIVPVCIVFFLSIYMNINDHIEVERKKSVELVGEISQIFDNANTANIDNVEVIASIFDYIDTTKIDEYRINNIMNDVSKPFEEYSKILVSFEDGIFIGNEVDFLPSYYNPKVRPWYINAVTNIGEIVKTEPYSNLNKNSYRWAITYSKTITKDGKLIGVVGADLNIYNIVDEIRELIDDSEAKIGIYDLKENLIWGSNSEINRTIDAEGSTFNSDIFKAEEQQPISILDKNYIKYSFYNEEVGLKIIYLKPKLNVIKEFQNEIVLSILVSIIMLMLAIIGVNVAKRRVELPVSRVVSKIGSIGDGNFDNIVEIEEKLPKEVNGIVIAVNKLVTQLKEQTVYLVQQKDEISSQYELIDILYKKSDKLNKKLLDSNESLLKSYKQTITSLSTAIEAKDEYTKGHCERVTKYAVATAKRINFDEADIEKLELSAILHDIGKIGVSTNIINKPGQLSEEEFDIVKEHPNIGSRIISEISFLHDIPQIIGQHHERIDGLGYPKGLKGGEISELAKILCIADAFDAMTSNRPYRTGKMSNKEALEELRFNKGSQFSERYVDAFIETVEELF